MRTTPHCCSAFSRAAKFTSRTPVCAAATPSASRSGTFIRLKPTFTTRFTWSRRRATRSSARLRLPLPPSLFPLPPSPFPPPASPRRNEECWAVYYRTEFSASPQPTPSHLENQGEIDESYCEPNCGRRLVRRDRRSPTRRADRAAVRSDRQHQRRHRQSAVLDDARTFV